MINMKGIEMLPSAVLEKRFGAMNDAMIPTTKKKEITMMNISIFQPRYDNRPKRPFALKGESVF